MKSNQPSPDDFADYSYDSKFAQNARRPVLETAGFDIYSLIFLVYVFVLVVLSTMLPENMVILLSIGLFVVVGLKIYKTYSYANNIVVNCYKCMQPTKVEWMETPKIGSQAQYRICHNCKLIAATTLTSDRDG